MKKTIIIALAALLALVGCTKENPISVSFEKATYVLLSDGTVDVKVVLNRAAATDLKIALNFGGTAVKGQDYTASAEAVTIPAGSNSGVVSISALDNLAESSIQLTLTPAEGCVAGAFAQTTIAVDAKEKIVYSFSSAKATVLDFYTIKLELKGMTSGASFVATADMEIPYKTSGKVESVNFESDFIHVAKGTNYGVLVVKPGEDMEIGDAAQLTVAVDDSKVGPRFVAGTNKEIELNVTGVLKLSQIEGTWNFDHIYDVELQMLFAEEDGLDVSLFPFENDGFSFTIAKADDGTYTFTPNSTGAFANYYRTATIDYCAPVNPTHGYEKLGDYCTMEENMYIGDEDAELEVQYFTYFSLSKVNRAFSAGTEKDGKGAVSFYRVPDGLLVVINDYDQPEFGEDWWDDDDFDPEMFGFAALFTRAE